MGKLKAPAAAGWNAGKNYYAKIMRIDDIVIDPEIARIFKMSDETREEITRDIRENGFDKSQPPTLWKGKNIVLDGHTRIAAAKAAGLEEIPVAEKEFEDKDDAILYTFERQVIRRNLTQAEILTAVQLMPERRNRRGEGRSAAQLARRLGVSEAHIYQAKSVLEKAPIEDIEAIKNGEKKIKPVYLKVNPPKTSAAGHDGVLKSAVILLAEAGENRAALLLTEHFFRKNEREAFLGTLPEKARISLSGTQSVPV
jgi:ParB family chromosome partitioning protein